MKRSALMICAILGAALLGALLVLFAWLAHEDYRQAQQDRTAEGPLRLSKDDLVELALFNALDPVPARESLRVVAVRFKGPDFALALWLDQNAGPEQGLGQVFIVDRQGETRMRRLSIPAATIRQLFEAWDQQIANYHGSAMLMLDGNSLAFERRSGAHVQSGKGNNPCHYDRLADLLGRQMAAYVPEMAALRFAPRDLSNEQYLCHPSIWGRMWHQLAIPTRP